MTKRKKTKIEETTHTPKEEIQTLKNGIQIIKNGYSKNGLKLGCPKAVYSAKIAMLNYFDLKDKNAVFDIFGKTVTYSSHYKKAVKRNYDNVKKPSAINTHEMHVIMQKFADAFKEKKEKAASENKKLLVALGEAHDYQHCALVELIISTFLNKQGFKSLLVEGNQRFIDSILSSKSTSKIALTFSSLGLGMKLLPIDPLNELVGNSEKDYTKRATEMERLIIKNADQNQLAIVGVAHLFDIIKSSRINEKFVVLSIDVTAGMLPETLSLDDIVPLHLSEQIESFSVKKLLDVFQKMIPYLVSDGAEIEEVIHYSDFDKNSVHCSPFKDIKNALDQWPNEDYCNNDYCV